jgi:hypothetical protein
MIRQQSDLFREFFKIRAMPPKHEGKTLKFGQNADTLKVSEELK